MVISMISSLRSFQRSALSCHRQIGILTALVFCLAYVLPSSDPAYAGGKKWKRALGVGVAVGVGAVMLKKLSEKKRKNKNIRKSRKRGKISTRTARRSNPARTEMRAIQAALNKRGFNAGKPDGIAGSKTRAAISAYQASINSAATGVLSIEQKQNLIGSSNQGSFEQVSSMHNNGECQFRIPPDRHEAVVQQFNKLMSEDDVSAYMAGYAPSYSINSCGVVTKKSGNRAPLRGHIRNLFVEQNEKWHTTAYYGFLKVGEGSSSLNGTPYNFSILFNRQTGNRDETAKWLLYMLEETEKLYQLAGYSDRVDGEFKKIFLDNALSTYDGRPDNADALRAFGAFIAKHSQSGSGYGNASGEVITAPSGGSSQSAELYDFQCTVYCEHKGGRTGEVSGIRVRADKSYRAESAVKDKGLNGICRNAGYYKLGGGFASDGINCRRQ